MNKEDLKELIEFRKWRLDWEERVFKEDLKLRKAIKELEYKGG